MIRHADARQDRAQSFTPFLTLLVCLLCLALPLAGQMAPIPQPAPDSTLRIASGDLLELAVFDTPEFSGKLRVSETGDVLIPVAGSVHVAGLTASQARAEGFSPLAVQVEAKSKPGYFGGSKTSVELVADRTTHKLLGGSVVGEDGAAGRINVVATALQAGLNGVLSVGGGAVIPAVLHPAEGASTSNSPTSPSATSLPSSLTSRT